MLTGEPVEIYGDGETTRDFCFVQNAVQANLLAALTANDDAVGRNFNVAVGEQNSLNRLHGLLANELQRSYGVNGVPPPRHQPPRAGDIRASLADIGLARELLGYAPTHTLETGLPIAARWYHEHLRGR
jgi:UDP-N-acetylglucosamine 4-epimerase